jgi:anaerobic selenocysteine-containing dehydrogenase
MALERPDDTRGYEHLFDEPFAQYTPAILPKPPGVIEDWEFFFRLASAMDLTLVLGSRAYEPGGPVPTSDELLEARAAHALVPHAEVRAHPHGKVFDEVAPTVVQPADPAAGGRLQVMPDDVAGELAAALDSLSRPARADRPFLLTVRRVRDSLNSFGRRSFNPCFAHPSDLAVIGAAPGDLVRMTSDHGSIVAVVEADDTMRPGAVSITHCYGNLPGEDDPLTDGANPSRLLDLEHGAQTINHMPWMTAVPVTLEPLGSHVEVTQDRGASL